MLEKTAACSDPQARGCDELILRGPGLTPHKKIHVAGARRTPRRLKTGGVPPKPPATIFPSLCPSVFWNFGSLFRTLRRHFLTRCRGSRLIRHRRCFGFGLVSRHKPAEHNFLMFPPRNCQCTRSSCRVEAKSTEKFSRSCASSVFPVRFNVISANCCGSGRPFLDVAAFLQPAVAAAAHRRCSVIPHHRRRVPLGMGRGEQLAPLVKRVASVFK